MIQIRKLPKGDMSTLTRCFLHRLIKIFHFNICMVIPIFQHTNPTSTPLAYISMGYYSSIRLNITTYEKIMTSRTSLPHTTLTGIRLVLAMLILSKCASQEFVMLTTPVLLIRRMIILLAKNSKVITFLFSAKIAT